MTRIFFALALGLAGSAQAQTAGALPAGANLSSLSAGANALNPGFGGVMGNHVTPTMQRQNLERAIALRDEAARLTAEDGGTLSAEHAAYIQKRVRKILGSEPTARTGSLVAQR